MRESHGGYGGERHGDDDSVIQAQAKGRRAPAKREARQAGGAVKAEDGNDLDRGKLRERIEEKGNGDKTRNRRPEAGFSYYQSSSRLFLA